MYKNFLAPNFAKFMKYPGNVQWYSTTEPVTGHKITRRILTKIFKYINVNIAVF